MNPTGMDTDLALIARIKRRDASALAELYDRYGARVFAGLRHPG